MKILNKTLPTTVILFIIAGILVGSAVAVAVAPIWSNSVKATVNPWNGQITLSLNSTNALSTFNSGDTIQFTATLSPAPLQPQILTVYYTTIVNPTSATPLSPDQDPSKGLVSGGTITTNSTGIAEGHWKPTVSGTFYFIAEVTTPT